MEYQITCLDCFIWLKMCQAGNQLFDSGKLAWVQYDSPTSCDVILPGGFRSSHVKDRHATILLRNPFGQEKLTNDFHCLQRTSSPSTPTLSMSQTTPTSPASPTSVSSTRSSTFPTTAEKIYHANKAHTVHFPKTKQPNDFQDDITQGGYTLRDQETISSTIMTSRIIHKGSTNGEITSSSISDSKTTTPTLSVKSSTFHFYLHYKNTPKIALTDHKGKNSFPESTKHSVLKTWTTNFNHSAGRNIPQVDPIQNLMTTTLDSSASKTTGTFDRNDYSAYDLSRKVEPPPDLNYLGQADNVCSSIAVLNGTQYCFIEELRTWNDSEEVCRSLMYNSHLVIIESEAENKFVTSFAIQERVGTHNDVWTGLNDIQNEGQWRWGDNDEEVKYFNWCTKWNDPNNGGSSTWDENCVFFSVAFEGGWFDDRCSALHSTMCEMHGLLVP